MSCPTEDELRLYSSGSGEAEWRARIATHAATCSSCPAKLRAMAKTIVDRPEPDVTTPGLRQQTESKGQHPGDKLGRYVLRKRIGAGGMGVVWSAHDEDLDRDVAIKILRGVGAELWGRFEREAHFTARLQHPAIVGVLEAGHLPTGEPFYVMRLVTGDSLDKLIEGRPGIAERMALLPSVIAVVNAVAFAHRAGIIHRDLKPENVLVGEFGETVVIDWGLAKAISGPEDTVTATDVSRAANVTAVGSVMGTPAFMPREQALGEPVDTRADVYSLGAMLFHLLVGQPPYTGGSAVKVLNAVISTPPPPLPSTGLPPDLRTIVSKAMAWKAADRYADAGELADDLRRFQTGQLVASHRYSAREHLGRWLDRHRASITVGAFAAVGLAVVAGVSVQRIKLQRSIAQQRRAEADQLLERTVLDMKAKLLPLGQVELLEPVTRNALTYFEQGEPPFSDGRLHRQEVMHATLGSILQARGDAAGALNEYRVAADRARELSGREPQNLAWQFNVGTRQLQLGETLLAQRDLPGASRELASGLATAAHVLSELPDDVDAKLAVTAIHENLADVAMATQHQADALSEYAVATTLADEALAAAAGNADVQHRVLSTHLKLGTALLDSDPAAAASRLHAALDLAERNHLAESGTAEQKQLIEALRARLATANERAPH